MECVIRKDKSTFRYKVQVTAIKNNHILLYKNPTTNLYELLSTQVNVMETSRDAIIKILEKKLAVSVSPESLKLKLIVEDFYNFKITKNQNHELSLVYLLNIDDSFKEIEQVEEGAIFGWFPFEELSKENISQEYVGLDINVLTTNGIQHLIKNGK